ncbi:MAG: amidase [Desulfobacteraceae bacterium]|nr:amidase [Desulfobacteraceae bacterium]
MSVYDLKTLSFPQLTGAGLKLSASVMENSLLQGIIAPKLLRDAGIPGFRSLIFDEDPCYTPIQGFGVNNAADDVDPDALLGEIEAVPEKSPAFPYAGVREYAAAYRSGGTDPVQVATRIMDAARKSRDMNIFIAMDEEDLLSQARAARERIEQGKPLGIFDGVPVAIKDEFHQVPYPTTVGTAFWGNRPASFDAFVVERLRNQGALLIGKANMHEIGINPNGLNVHFGAVRNPYNRDHDTGGSSSGPAAAVAAGLAPVAMGADGGGSIRVPSGYCGVVGIKPTYGRVSEYGAAPLCWSVAHIGPIAASVEDLVLAYAAVAGKDPRDPNSLRQPPVTVAGWNNPDLSGLRIGVFKEWNAHCDPQCDSCCNAMIEKFEQAGARVRSIEIPELDAMRVAHVILIISEMAASMADHKDKRGSMGAAVRINLALAKLVTASDYVNAQRMRTRAMNLFNDIFNTVDLIVSPGSAATVPPIPKGFEQAGWSSLSTELQSMRYVFPGNLTGFPAITFPGGYDTNGLPLSIHAMAAPWQEALLFRLAHAAEAVVERRLPGDHYPVLG